MLEIPGYTIRKLIAEGGMNHVYVAKQKELGRYVALKVLDLRVGNEDSEIERFMQEGRIIASLQHSHIINIFDFGYCKNHLYLAMEYLRGGDLGLKLRKRAPSTYRVLKVTLQIARALCYAHDRQIVHRDVKPGNILFRSKHTVVLSDFGIAKMLDNTDVAMTQDGYTVGSPHYLSPEQASGEKLDGRSDIYSLGIIVYEMLMRERPFDGAYPMDILMQHLEAPVPKLPEQLKFFQPLLHRMLAKEPCDRFQDASALIRYLKAMRLSIGSTRRFSKDYFSLDEKEDEVLFGKELEDLAPELAMVKKDAIETKRIIGLDEPKSVAADTFAELDNNQTIPMERSTAIGDAVTATLANQKPTLRTVKVPQIPSSHRREKWFGFRWLANGRSKLHLLIGVGFIVICIITLLSYF